MHYQIEQRNLVKSAIVAEIPNYDYFLFTV